MFRVLERNMANVRQSHEKLVVAEFGNMDKERNLLREKKKSRKVCVQREEDAHKK
jgi:hypothetical protein